MKYRVIEDMNFVRDWRSNTMILIKKGTIVDGVHNSEMSDTDKRAFQHMEQRLRKDKPTKRYAFFRYEGQVRAGLAIDELRAVRK